MFSWRTIWRWAVLVAEMNGSHLSREKRSCRPVSGSHIGREKHSCLPWAVLISSVRNAHVVPWAVLISAVRNAYVSCEQFSSRLWETFMAPVSGSHLGCEKRSCRLWEILTSPVGDNRRNPYRKWVIIEELETDRNYNLFSPFTHTRLWILFFYENKKQNQKLHSFQLYREY